MALTLFLQHSQYVFFNPIIFVKSRPLLLKCPLSFSSAANVHKWGMFDEGSTILKVSYQTTNFQIRGQIPIAVEINNTRGKLQVKSVNVKGIRRVQFKRIRDATVRATYQNIMFNKDFAVNVPPNTQSQIYNYNIEITDDSLVNFNYIGVLKSREVFEEFKKRKLVDDEAGEIFSFIDCNRTNNAKKLFKKEGSSRGDASSENSKKETSRNTTSKSLKVKDWGQITYTVFLSFKGGFCFEA